jgi:hypothetical protein
MKVKKVVKQQPVEPSRATEELFMEIELDEEMHREIRRLAQAAGVTPFEMCVILLRERLSSSAAPKPPE